MQEYTELKLLLKQIMRLVGNGYKYISISKIPKNKLHKKHKILEKLERKYDLNLTTWQRQYKRRKNKANYKGLIYQDTIMIFRTEGETEIKDNSFKSVLNTPISFNYLSVILYKDEREKLTYRLNKELIKTIKANIALALKNKNGTKFHNEIKKLYNLHKVMPYRGFMLQLKTILEFIKKKQKYYNTNYTTPTFFK